MRFLRSRLSRRLARAARRSAAVFVAATAVAVLAWVAAGSNVVAAAVTLGALAVAGLAFLSALAGAVDGWFRRVRPDPGLLALDPTVRALADRPALSNADYDLLVGYFAAGVLAYRGPCRAWVLYPGEPSTRGTRIEGLEGFARSAPLLAAWVRSGRGDTIRLPNGPDFDAYGHLVAGLRAGTDPRSPEYWGGPEALVEADHRIVEAGDIALVLWMLRGRLSADLSPAELRPLLAWLKSTLERPMYGGNWNLFPLTAALTLQAYGVQVSQNLIDGHYRSFKDCYLGDGWFSDGYGGKVDFYNAWQMHYLLYFVAQMDPNLDAAFIVEVMGRFAAGFQYFFSPQGFPIFGRSLCYRMALPAPLVLTSGLAGSPISPGLARRALDATWIDFIGRGALAAGMPTQGYGAARPSLMENYTGRGSSLWALRSLVAAYWFPREAPLWTTAPDPLPIERGSYDLTIAAAGLQVVGDHATQAVELRIAGNAGRPILPPERMSLLRRLGEMALRRPLRHANIEIKYRRPVYRSDAPICDLF